MPNENYIDTFQNSEDISEIITSEPVWIIRNGVTLVFLILILIITMSALINYPDIIRTDMKINATNAPKSILAHHQGKLTKLLVQDGQEVDAKTNLAFIESTGDHNEVIKLSLQLRELNSMLDSVIPISSSFVNTYVNLGELQGNFRSFHQEYIQYLNTEQDGFYLSQRKYLEKDLNELNKLNKQIEKENKLQKQEYANALEEYEAYTKLRDKKVISNSEFRQAENKFITSKYPLEQNISASINNNSNILAKEKEIATLDNTIKEQRTKFRQSVNAILNETNDWLLKYVVTASVSGKVNFAGILVENQNIVLNQELFIISPANTGFYGEIKIPQYNMGKIKVGQRTLVKLKSYPYEEFGILKGEVSFITDVAFRDSLFIAKIDLDINHHKKTRNPVTLKAGMLADAEIITRESSLLQRFLYGINRIFHK